MRKALRAVAATACVGLMLAGAGGTAVADEPEGPNAKPGTDVYLVHGYGYDKTDDGKDMKGKDCNNVWGNAKDYISKQGWIGQLKTVGYYEGDTHCDVTLGDGKATKDTRIRTLAAELAEKIHNDNLRGESVDVVAHSMGGLITRVALLGSANGWEGFPKAELKVNDVVTLGTPHEGVKGDDGTCDGKNSKPNKQWASMYAESEFMDVLHRQKNSLGEWGKKTDWSFVGAREDQTVCGSSAIDEGHDSNHKYWYNSGGDHKLGHSELRTFYKGNYNLNHWHTRDSGKKNSTDKGWAPLEIAYNAIDKNDKW